MLRVPLRLFIACLLVLPSLLNAEEKELEVLIRAWANPEYIRELDAQGVATAESCTFYPGHYYAADYRGAPEIKFEEVASILSKHLASQNYTMAAEPAAANLLLVVNWGQTSPEEEDLDLDIDGGYSGLDPTNTALERKRAQLIGAGKVFDMHPWRLKRKILEEALREDRYFIDVAAFSLAELRERPDKSKIPKPKWITIMSVPSHRVAPERGLAAMSETASTYFGRNLEDLTFLKEGEKRGVVTIGEIEFIEYLDDGEKREEE